MAKEFEKIFDLLVEMKNEDAANTEAFDRILSNISNKIEYLSGNDNSVELIKAYLQDISSNLDERYSVALDKFSDIEKALKIVYDSQDEHVKTEDMRQLFDIFSKNVNGFYDESQQQKVLIQELKTKITEISQDKSGQREVSDAIGDLKDKLENLNHSYSLSSEEIANTLQSLITKLGEIDQSEINRGMKKQLNTLVTSISAINEVVKGIENKNSELEYLLKNVVTNESLKLTQGAVDEISEKSDKLVKAIENTADKSDIKGLEKAAKYMNNKLDDLSTKNDLSKLSHLVDELMTHTDEIKQTLGGITQNISDLPDTQKLEEAIQKVYETLDSISENISQTDVKGEVFGIASRLEAFKADLDTIKTIISDLSEAVNSKILSAISSVTFEDECADIKSYVTEIISALPQKSDIQKILTDSDKTRKLMSKLSDQADMLADKIDSLPTHDDMERMHANQTNLVDNLQEIVTKQDIETLYSKTDEVNEKIENLNFDREFENIYDKTSSIEDWLENSKIKENSAQILSQIKTKAEQDLVKKLLATTEKVVRKLEDISLSQGVTEKGENVKVSGVSEIIESISELKNELLNTQGVSNDSTITRFAELKKVISENVSSQEFTAFIDDLKDALEEILRNTSSIVQNGGLNELKKVIIDRIDHIDYLEITSAIEFGFSGLNDAIRKTTDEIKEMISNQQFTIEEIPSEDGVSGITASDIEELKAIMDKNSYNLSSEIHDKLSEVVTELNTYKQEHSSDFDKISDMMEAYVSKVGANHSSDESLNQTLEEISTLRKDLSDLKLSYVSSDSGVKEDISSFVASKIQDLTKSLDEFKSEVEDSLQTGMTANSQILEDKTQLLLDAVKNLRHSNTSNPQTYEKLGNTDIVLENFKQELDLIKTDIIENFSSKNEEYISELSELRESVAQIEEKYSSSDSISSKLEDIQYLISDLKGGVSDSDGTAISGIDLKLKNTENAIKDVILGDTDSIIIKLDGLKEYIESSLSSIKPPSPEQMKELQAFSLDIEQFISSQNEKIQQAADSINENIESKYEELKSLISTATNNKEIIAAIESLEDSFRSNFKAMVSNKKDTTDSAPEEFEETKYERVFDDSSIEKYISNLKNDFESVSSVINNLSNKNEEIESVLKTISEKIDSISLVNNSDYQTVDINDELLDEISQTDEEYSVDTNGFDFEKAFDLLKEDIKNISLKFEKFIESDRDAQAKLTNLVSGQESGVSKESAQDIVNSLKSDWLVEIKTYLKEGNAEITNILNEINEKIDSLQLKSENSDWIEEIKAAIKNLNPSDVQEDDSFEIMSLLSTIDSKLDILAMNNDSETISDIEDAINDVTEELKPVKDDIQNLTLSDAKITEMLEDLNYKIDNISDSDSYKSGIDEVKQLISSQSDYAQQLDAHNEKTEAFKQCLSDLTEEINKLSNDSNAGAEQIQASLKDMKKSIMEAVVTIFSQVSFLEESEDIKDFVEERTSKLSEGLNAVTEQLRQMSSSAESGEYSYSMQDIETDLSKLRVALNQIQSNSNTEDKSEELKNLQSDILNLREQTQQLVISSGSLNTGLEGFSKNIVDTLSFKVDNMFSALEKLRESNSVMRKALIYMGEWIDSTSECMNKQTKILNNLEEKFDESQAGIDFVEKQMNKFNGLEERLASQEERIDRLERNIDKVLSTLEDMDNSALSRKIDKIDKHMSKLSTDIEKLTSYVD